MIRGQDYMELTRELYWLSEEVRRMELMDGVRLNAKLEKSLARIDFLVARAVVQLRTEGVDTETVFDQI